MHCLSLISIFLTNSWPNWKFFGPHLKHYCEKTILIFKKCSSKFTRQKHCPSPVLSILEIKILLRLTGCKAGTCGRFSVVQLSSHGVDNLNWRVGGGAKRCLADILDFVSLSLDKISKNGRKIHNFGATAKFFTYFWGSTKFLIQWWWFHVSKRGGGSTAPPLCTGLSLWKLLMINAEKAVQHQCNGCERKVTKCSHFI